MRTKRNKRPPITTMHPLNAPRKKIPARDFRGGGAGGDGDSSSDIAASLLRRIRVRRLVMLFDRRGAVLQTLFLGQRLDVARGQPDLPLGGIDLDDPRANRVARLKELVEFLPHVALHFRNVSETFHSIRKTNEQTEVGDLRDRAD